MTEQLDWPGELAAHEREVTGELEPMLGAAAVLAALREPDRDPIELAAGLATVAADLNGIGDDLGEEYVRRCVSPDAGRQYCAVRAEAARRAKRALIDLAVLIHEMERGR